MSINNLITTPIAQARTFRKRLHLHRAASYLALKAVRVYYGSTRSPFPKRALIRILKAQMFSRIGLQPGNPGHVILSDALRIGGMVSIARDLHLLAPNHYVIRLSGDQTITYELLPREEQTILRYLNNSVAIYQDIDTIRAWCLANKREGDMLATYHMDRNNPGFNTTWNNVFIITQLPSANRDNNQRLINFNPCLTSLLTQQRDLKASHSTLVLFLFHPILLNDVVDYIVLNSIRYNTAIVPQLVLGCTQDMLTWFFQSGNCVAPPYPRVAAPASPFRQAVDTSPLLPPPNKNESSDSKPEVDKDIALQPKPTRGKDGIRPSRKPKQGFSFSEFDPFGFDPDELAVAVKFAKGLLNYYGDKFKKAKFLNASISQMGAIT